MVLPGGRSYRPGGESVRKYLVEGILGGPCLDLFGAHQDSLPASQWQLLGETQQMIKQICLVVEPPL